MSTRPYIAVVQRSHKVDVHINSKHSVTFDQVKDAVVLRENIRWEWESDPETGVEKLLVYSDDLKIVLYPVDHDGTWNLATAFRIG